ncbi:MAG: glycosyltransferase, partial [Veillonellaceae bacterium]|nr:glycosyltransferase [Veillonellaceae bacterium]
DLKFIESAGHGAVVLASPTVYERTVVDGCTGCIYHNPEEFSEKLARLIEDAPYRHAIADAAYGYVRKHRLLSQHYMERIRAYSWLIEHREELDRELEERLKEI